MPPAARALYEDLKRRDSGWLFESGTAFAAKRPSIGRCFTLRHRTPALGKPQNIDRSGALDDLRRHRSLHQCKYTDCVEVCPVDCFYEGENMLVIHPDECIDCGVCEPECPADAIKPDTEPGLEKWLEVNAEYAKTWPNITQKKDAPADAKEFDGVEGKFEKYFSPNPARLGLTVHCQFAAPDRGPHLTLTPIDHGRP